MMVLTNRADQAAPLWQAAVAVLAEVASRLQPAHRFAQQLRQFRNVRRDALGFIAGE